VVSETEPWSRRRSRGLGDRAVVSETEPWSRRQSRGLGDGAVVSETKPWSRRRSRAFPNRNLELPEIFGRGRPPCLPSTLPGTAPPSEAAAGGDANARRSRGRRGRHGGLPLPGQREAPVPARLFTPLSWRVWGPAPTVAAFAESQAAPAAPALPIDTPRSLPYTSESPSSQRFSGTRSPRSAGGTGKGLNPNPGGTLFYAVQ
jgi:hypothetical protein